MINFEINENSLPIIKEPSPTLPFKFDRLLIPTEFYCLMFNINFYLEYIIGAYGFATNNGKKNAQTGGFYFVGAIIIDLVLSSGFDLDSTTPLSPIKSIIVLMQEILLITMEVILDVEEIMINYSIL